MISEGLLLFSVILGRCTAGDGDSVSFRSVLTDTGLNLIFADKV